MNDVSRSAVNEDGTPSTGEQPEKVVSGFIPDPVVNPAVPESAVPTDSVKSGKSADEALREQQEQQEQLEQEEVKETKLVLFDSAELAIRAAGLAATNAGELREASRQLTESSRKQRNVAMILLAVSAVMMLLACAVFAGITLTLQSRITRLNTVVSTVGKSVTEMNASMEMVGSVQEAIKELVVNQEAFAGVQKKVEARIDDLIKTSQGAPESAAKLMDGKTEAMTKQLASLDSRLQAQAVSLKALTSQIQGFKVPPTDTAVLRRELDNFARQQRERQVAESAANSSNAAAAARTRERPLLQYPRVAPAPDKP